MGRFALALLATLWLAAPAWGATQDCTFAVGASSWTAVGTITGVGVDCSDVDSPGGDDNFIIQDGANVTIDGTITMDGTSDTSILVQSGGTLVCIESETADCILNYNTDDAIPEAPGIDCQEGSVCTFQGTFRQFSNASPTLQTDLDDAGLGFAGKLLPCPAWDDTDDRFEMDCAKHETYTAVVTGGATGAGTGTLTLDGNAITVTFDGTETAIGIAAARISDAAGIRSNSWYAGQDREDEEQLWFTAEALGDAAGAFTWAAGTSGVLIAGGLVKVHDGEASAVGVSPDRASSEWEYGIIYPHDTYDEAGAAGDEGASEIIHAIDAMEAGDLLCWWDTDQTDTWAPHDVNQCYEILLADGDTTVDRGSDVIHKPAGTKYAVLILDILQTNPNRRQHSDYPFYLRSIKADVVNADVARSERSVVLTGTDVITEDDMIAGRWIRFGDCATSGACLIGELLDKTYFISDDTNDAGGDQFNLLDPNGVRAAVAATDDAVIDYGWREGHPFFVMKPAILREADENHGTADSLENQYNGTTTMEQVLLDSGSGFEHIGATAPTLSHVIGRDTQNRNAIRFSSTTALTYFANHLVLTGGQQSCQYDLTNTARTCDDHHGFICNAAAHTCKFYDYTTRHLGDGWGVPNGVTVDVKRTRCDHSSGGGDSANFFVPTGVNPSGTVDGAVVASCTSPDANNEVWSFKAGPVGPVYASNIVDVHNANMINFAVADSTPVIFSNYLRGTGWPNTTALPAFADRMVVQDTNMAGGSDLIFSFAGEGAKWTNSIIQNVVSTGSELLKTGVANSSGPGTVIENTAFINVSANAGGQIVRYLGDEDPVSTFEFNRCSFVWQRGNDAVVNWVFEAQAGDVTAAGYAGFTMDGVLVQGFDQTSGNGAAVAGNGAALLAANMERFCINNGDRLDGSAPALAALPATTIRDRELQLIDLEDGLIGPIKGGVADVNQCGVKGGAASPGLTKPNWALSVVGLDPIFTSVGVAGGGGGGSNPRTY